MCRITTMVAAERRRQRLMVCHNVESLQEMPLVLDSWMCGKELLTEGAIASVIWFELLREERK